MKTSFITALFASLLPLVGLAQEAIPTIFQKTEASNPANPDYRFLWRTDPGVRYHLQTSDDLADWDPVPGYPKTAEGPVEFHDHTPATGGKQFFQAIRLDEQAPVVVRSNPADGDFAVRRFSDLTFVLDDFTGIDRASIQLVIGGGAPLTLAGSSNLTFQDNILTYDVIDTPLGSFGQQVTLSLTLADTLGNSTTHNLVIEVEKQAQLAVDEADIFVFGSAAAQRAGQRLSARQQTVAQAIVGPVRLPANGGNTYELTQVLVDRLILTFTGTAPVFAVNNIVTNTAPSGPEEVFYRRILSQTSSGNTLTLFTQTLSLKDVVMNGTIGLSDESIILDPTGSTPARQAAREIDGRYEFAPISFNSSGWEAGINVEYPEGVEIGAKIVPHDFSFSLTPYVGCSAEIKSGQLERIDGRIGGDAQINMVFDLEISTAVNLVDKEIKLSKVFPTLPFLRSYFTYLGNVGVVPVFGGISPDLEFVFSADIDAAGTWRMGVQRDFTAEVGIEWPGNQDLFRILSSKRDTPIMPHQTSSSLAVSTELKIVPRVDFLLYGMVGVGTGFYPYWNVEYEGSTGGSGVTPKAEYTKGWKYFAEVIDALDIINARFEKELGTPVVIDLLDPNRQRAEPLVSLTSSEVNIAMCHVPSPQFPNRPLQTMLYYGGNPIPGTFDIDSLTLPARPYEAPLLVVGKYQDEAGQTVNVQSTLTPPLTHNPTPAGFSLIPAGPFTMGRTSGDTDINAPPVTVTVSAFYMAKYEVTKALWDEVRAWGLNHGYSDLPAGSGKASNHPVHTISWFDMLKWCNARSQKEGLTPVYTVSGAVMKTGTTAPTANWSANGYRLPTEAEWEKAARGGVSGKRFPWGTDTINHSNANYRANSGAYNYDTSGYTTSTYHPTYEVGSTVYSSPVGSFAPNGYGLYDMAGNMWEWCWDWYGASTYVNGATNPSGPSSGAGRVGRGGGFGLNASYCRAAHRGGYGQTVVYGSVGFRLARTSVP